MRQSRRWNGYWFPGLPSAGFVDAIVGRRPDPCCPRCLPPFPAPPATLLGTNKAPRCGHHHGHLAVPPPRADALARHAARRRQRALPGPLPVPGPSPWCRPTSCASCCPWCCWPLLYTLAKRIWGATTPPPDGAPEAAAACAIGLSVGFYDGFFGPGTGSFFVFLFVRLLGYDFLNASASAKLLNVSTNIAALILFTAKGHVVALCVAAGCGQRGGQPAGHTHGLKHGAGFVRWIFIVVVSALILKTGYDGFALIFRRPKPHVQTRPLGFSMMAGRKGRPL